MGKKKEEKRAERAEKGRSEGFVWVGRALLWHFRGYFGLGFIEFLDV